MSSQLIESSSGKSSHDGKKKIPGNNRGSTPPSVSPIYGNDRFIMDDPLDGWFSRVALRSATVGMGMKYYWEGRDQRLRRAHDLLNRWHGTLERLRGSPDFDDSFLVKSLQCPPVGARFRSIGFRYSYCSRWAFCPMCWGREAVRVWKRLLPLLFPDGPGDAEDRSCYSLVSVHREFALPPVVKGPDGRIVGDSRQVFLDARNGRVSIPGVPVPRRTSERSKSGKLADVAGMVEVLSLEPTVDDGSVEGWTAHIRQLRVIAPPFDYVLPPMRCPSAVRNRWRPTREEAADALSETFRYPASLLDAPPNDLAQYLAIRKGRTMVTLMGGLRESQKDEEES